MCVCVCVCVWCVRTHACAFVKTGSKRMVLSYEITTLLLMAIEGNKSDAVHIQATKSMFLSKK